MPARVTDCIAAACTEYNISREEVMGAARTSDIVLARHVAMYLARQMSGRGVARIGRAFDRDHTTVIHGCKSVERRMESDMSFRIRMGALRESLVDATCSTCGGLGAHACEACGGSGAASGP